MNVDILIPVGGTPCPSRERARKWVIGRYCRLHPRWRIIEGACGADPWSKGEAVAAAFRQSSAEMLVLADADSIVAPAYLLDAVKAARVGGWAMPHWMVHRLTPEASEAVYAGGEPSTHRGALTRGSYVGTKAGGILAITREAFETVGGIDPRFVGWGGEDASFALALRELVGGHARMGGDLFHLWHPHPAPDLRGSAESEALVARYKAARGEPALMRALVDEHTQVPA